jgi:predicted short-subunit dehydrogenase-like oxidoreductase (DUF2520 family)
LNGLIDTDFRIVLVGAGNLAWHLGHSFLKNGVKIELVISRTLDSARSLAAEINSSFSDSLIEIPADIDFIIIAVNDSNIAEVIQRMEPNNAIVVHTSGNMNMNLLKGKFKRFGVLYPFQTFTRGVRLDMDDVPLCVEGSDSASLELICILAGMLSSNIRRLNSEQRRVLHLCGVMVNNFTNHLITRATDLMSKQSLEKELLLPLLYETIRKLETTPASAAQTGPARRQDLNIIENQMEMLDEDPELKKLYSSLTDSIIAYYSK